MSWWQLLKVFGDAGINNGRQEQSNYDKANANASSNRQEGIQYASAPQSETGSGIHLADNVAKLGGWGDASALESMPGTSKGSAAEARMGNSPTAVGGFSVQSTDINSSQQPYSNSGMANYLNYLKYRGGY